MSGIQLLVRAVVEADVASREQARKAVGAIVPEVKLLDASPLVELHTTAKGG